MTSWIYLEIVLLMTSKDLTKSSPSDFILTKIQVMEPRKYLTKLRMRIPNCLTLKRKPSTTKAPGKNKNLLLQRHLIHMLRAVIIHLGINQDLKILTTNKKRKSETRTTERNFNNKDNKWRNNLKKYFGNFLKRPIRTKGVRSLIKITRKISKSSIWKE